MVAGLGAAWILDGLQVAIATPGSSGIALAWKSNPGKIYRVQFKESLDQEEAWITLSPNLTATSTQLSFVDTTGPLG